MDDDLTDDPSAGDPLGELEQLISAGLFDGLVRQIRSHYPWLGKQNVEDAVAEAVERVVRRLQRGPLHGNLADYVFKAALNSARKTGRTVARRAETSLHAVPEATVSRSLEDDALRAMAVGLLLAEVRSWENTNIREVTLVYLEAAVAGEPMEAGEVADVVSQVLGEEINLRSVSQWKARGFRRLGAFYRRIAGTDEADDIAWKDEE
jgi:DNA-directed RNA polymerase specialized sigma24 family protein